MQSFNSSVKINQGEVLSNVSMQKRYAKTFVLTYLINICVIRKLLQLSPCASRPLPLRHR